MSNLQMSACLSGCLSVRMCFCLPVSCFDVLLYVYLSLCQSVYMLVCSLDVFIYVYLVVYLSGFLYVWMYIWMSFWMCGCISGCLDVHMSVSVDVSDLMSGHLSAFISVYMSWCPFDWNSVSLCRDICIDVRMSYVCCMDICVSLRISFCPSGCGLVCLCLEIYLSEHLSV